jgi:quercetin dioxygenase-like cupin family protein
MITQASEPTAVPALAHGPIHVSEHTMATTLEWPTESMLKGAMPAPVFAEPTRISAGVVFHRDGIKVSRVVMAADSELPPHNVPDNVMVVVLRGTGILMACGTAHAMEAGTVIDLLPGEQHSVVGIEELEFIICQVTIANRQDLLP